MNKPSRFTIASKWSGTVPQIWWILLVKIETIRSENCDIVGVGIKFDGNPLTVFSSDEVQKIIMLAPLKSSEQGQTTQWPKSTKHTHKTKDRVTRNPQKKRGELRCSGRVGSSCSTSGTRRVNLAMYNLGDMSWMRKGPGGVYKWNIFVVICDTDIP